MFCFHGAQICEYHRHLPAFDLPFEKHTQYKLVENKLKFALKQSQALAAHFFFLLIFENSI